MSTDLKHNRIFDTAIKKQKITCFYTNTSSNILNNVNIYLEGISDPGIIPIAHSYFFPKIKPGASVKISWLADFENGSFGKKIVSFIAKAEGMNLVRTMKHIFVSKTTRNVTTGEYLCEIEEGVLRISQFEVVGPKNKWEPCSEKIKECKPTKGPWIPAKMSMEFIPNPSYSGTHGDLPFNDPWWKIVAWIVAAVAAIVAIVAAAKGEGTAGVAVNGSFDETTGDINCCEPDTKGIPGDDSLTIAGVASAISMGAIAVGLSDAADPFWRGQEATIPLKNELTISEKLDVLFNYPNEAPNAGRPYPVKVKWKYQRITTGKTYSHEIEETQKNIHINGGTEINVPNMHYAFKEPLIIETKFRRDNGELFSGNSLYAFALLKSPDNMYFFIDLVDDGILYDKQPNDGIYTGGIHLEEIYKVLLKNQLSLEGLWKVYVFAQDINDATPDMLPHIAATRIGGCMIASGLNLTFDSSLPCPLQAQATFSVVI